MRCRNRLRQVWAPLASKCQTVSGMTQVATNRQTVLSMTAVTSTRQTVLSMREAVSKGQVVGGQTRVDSLEWGTLVVKKAITKKIIPTFTGSMGSRINSNSFIKIRITLWLMFFVMNVTLLYQRGDSIEESLIFARGY